MLLEAGLLLVISEKERKKRLKSASLDYLFVMKSLIHPSCFPSIAHFVVMIKSGALLLEMEDNYQKQTYRNRFYIYGANGKQLLSVPILHSKTERQKYKDVRIEYSFNWQKLHWKSLQTAYRTSPYFEFYEDDIAPLFEKKHDFLMDYNLYGMECICECLSFDLNFEYTKSYEKEHYDRTTDLRALINAKKEQQYHFDHYTQVFHEKHGFIENLSILDLLFNEGTNAVTYLQNQKLAL